MVELAVLKAKILWNWLELANRHTSESVLCIG